jgi:NADH-quinone oxidoreductase subunit L
MDSLLWMIPAFPFASAAVLALFGSRLSRRLAALLGTAAIGLSAVVAILVAAGFLSSPSGETQWVQHLWTWMNVGDFRPEVGFYFDPVALVMVLVITFVGFLIHLYSVEYMRDDEGFSRFFAYMDLFVAAMLTLVLANNLLLLYLGWEGVGLCSFLLIGFWYKDPANVRAANKAFLVTRVGDTAMVIGLFLIATHLRTLDIQEVMQRATQQWPVGSGIAIAAAALLLGGAVGKSAQLPLQTWLPDAMAGPTPTSALIHAATMVTAGVYLIARTNALFRLAPPVAFAVALIGTATMLMAAFSAIAQRDIKRVLAYSTMSQIGYMFMALGLGAWSAAIFHFMTHAFFKALLFLAAGNVIHAFHDDQDIRHMGNLRAGLPITFWTFLIGTVSVSGFPLFAGFFSKDEIIRAALSAPGTEFWLGVLALITAGLTAYYMFRLFFIAFGWEWLSRDDRHLHEALPVQTIPIVILAVGAVVGGYIPVASFLSPVFGGGVEVGTGAFIGLAALSVLVALAGFTAAYILHARRPELAVAWRTRLRPVHALVEHKYYVDELYDLVFVRPGLALGRFLNDVVEPRVIDGAVNAVADFFLVEAREFRLIQTGRVRSYALWTLGGAIGVVLVVAAFLGYLPVRFGG